MPGAPFAQVGWNDEQRVMEVTPGQSARLREHAMQPFQLVHLHPSRGPLDAAGGERNRRANAETHPRSVTAAYRGGQDLLAGRADRVEDQLRGVFTAALQTAQGLRRPADAAHRRAVGAGLAARLE